LVMPHRSLRRPEHPVTSDGGRRQSRSRRNSRQQYVACLQHIWAWVTVKVTPASAESRETAEPARR
jgi:hypothetical protein